MVCPQCKAVTRLPKEIAKHVVKHYALSSKYAHQCPVCGVRFTIQIELKPVVKSVKLRT